MTLLRASLRCRSRNDGWRCIRRRGHRTFHESEPRERVIGTDSNGFIQTEMLSHLWEDSDNVKNKSSDSTKTQ